MTNVKITDLSNAGSVGAADEVEAVVSGASRAVTAQVLAASLAKLIGSSPRTVITTSSTFTTPADSSVDTEWEYEMVGGGGGGAGNATTDAIYGAAGGGYAEYRSGSFTGVAGGTGIGIIIGAGGAGGAATGGAGGDGGDTTIGSPVSVVATGGKGGPSPTSGNTAGGDGGHSGSGTASNEIKTRGEAGQSTQAGIQGGYSGGRGGSGMFGAGGSNPAFTGAVGNPGLGYGAGGSGARGTGAASRIGGAGSPGLVIIRRIRG